MRTLTICLLLTVSIALLGGCSTDDDSIATPPQVMSANVVHDGSLSDESLNSVLKCIPSDVIENSTGVSVINHRDGIVVGVDISNGNEDPLLYKVNVFAGTAECINCDKQSTTEPCAGFWLSIMRCMNACQASGGSNCLQECLSYITFSDCYFPHRP